MSRHPAGRFREAAEKYAKAAESPDAPADRKGDFYLNSAWSFYIAGNSHYFKRNRIGPAENNFLADRVLIRKGSFCKCSTDDHHFYRFSGVR